MAAEIEKAVGVTSDLVKGGSGVFDVFVDGSCVFSKDDAGRYPEHEEILKALRD